MVVPTGRHCVSPPFVSAENSDLVTAASEGATHFCSNHGIASSDIFVAPASCRLSQGHLPLARGGGTLSAAGTAALQESSPREMVVDILLGGNRNPVF
jgi:hypothetical protein